MTNEDKTLSEVKGLSNVFILLGRIWQRELDEEFDEAFRTGTLKFAWAAAGEVDIDNLDLEELSQEYCRLFIGPADHFPPYQSVWTEGEFRGECVTSSREFYSILPDQMQDLKLDPDHLGVQMTFAGLLLSEYASAEDNARRTAAKEALERFSLKHLRWPRELLKLSGEAAKSGFYKTTIHWTTELLKNSSVYLDAMSKIR